MHVLAQTTPDYLWRPSTRLERCRWVLGQPTAVSEGPRANLPLAHLILQHVVLAELVAVFEGLHPNLGEVG